jgi:HK97 family phage major capsid protein
MPTIDDELSALHDQARGLLAGWEEAGMEPSAEAYERLNEIERRMKALSTQKTARQKTIAMLDRYAPGAAQVGGASPTSLGAAIVSHPEFKEIQRHAGSDGPHRTVVELKALTGSVACTPQLPPPLPGLPPSMAPVLAARLRVAQLVPHVEVPTGSITYLQITGKTGGAAVVPPGTLKPAYVMNGAFLPAALITLASHIVVDDAMLEDADGLQALLNAELASDLADVLDDEIVAGTGAGHWTGLLTGATGAPYAVVAGQSPLDAILAASAALEDASGRAPDAIVMSASTYAACIAVKATGSGVPLVPPTPYPALVFPGTTLRLALNSLVPAGQAVLGAYWLGAKLDMKRGLRLDASNSVADSFLKNQTILRVEVRCFFAITRPPTFGLITGLPAPA